MVSLIQLEKNFVAKSQKITQQSTFFKGIPSLKTIFLVFFATITVFVKFITPPPPRAQTSQTRPKLF